MLPGPGRTPGFVCPPKARKEGKPWAWLAPKAMRGEGLFPAGVGVCCGRASRRSSAPGFTSSVSGSESGKWLPYHLAHVGTECMKLTFTLVYSRKIILYVNRFQNNLLSTYVKTYPVCPLELQTPFGISFSFSIKKRESNSRGLVSVWQKKQAPHDDFVSWLSTGLIPQAYATGTRLAADIY